MIKYYRESNGDYLSIDTESRNGSGDYDGRATAIPGVISSVCTTGIGDKFLARCCTEITEAEVPSEWLEMIK